MNILRLSKDHYRVREMYQGKSYSKYYPYKPTQREAQNDINEMIEKENIIGSDTFDKCANLFINAKTNILSPSTIRRYTYYIKKTPQMFKDYDITTIDNIKLQALINDYAVNHKPKSIKTYYGFISSVMNAYTDKRFRVILPPLQKSTAYIPTKEEVKQIIEEARGTPYQIPIILASYGMRIGEIMALTLEDIDDGQITINKTITYDIDYKKIIKPPKTIESNRTVKVPTYITDLIKQKREIYKGSSTAINRFLYRTQDLLGIKRFSIHKLRHFFATELHNRNVPSKYIQAMGGWATDNVMKTVYTHTNKELETFDLLN